jgi:hypothetical protein
MGICHICQRIELVKYCGLCKHWLCDACRPKWPARVKAAAKAAVTGMGTDCCGPLREVTR